MPFVLQGSVIVTRGDLTPTSFFVGQSLVYCIELPNIATDDVRPWGWVLEEPTSVTIDGAPVWRSGKQIAVKRSLYDSIPSANRDERLWLYLNEKAPLPDILMNVYFLL